MGVPFDIGLGPMAWTQRLLLTGDLARAEPKRLRYRLLHVAARLAFHARMTAVNETSGDELDAWRQEAEDIRNSFYATERVCWGPGSDRTPD
jgi:hypothetical protein